MIQFVCGLGAATNYKKGKIEDIFFVIGGGSKWDRCQAMPPL